MRIINPAYALIPGGSEQITAEPANWLSDSMVLFSNSKPNARELLLGMREKLGAVRPVDNIDFMHKNSASAPAPAGMIDQIAQKYRMALVALGD